MRSVRRVAVLGSGVMGSAIAAHFANVGIPSLLLDIVPTRLTEEETRLGLSLSDRRVRDRIARAARDGLSKGRPNPLYRKDDARRIEVGNLEDDLERLGDFDWIIEAVVERLDVKRGLLERVDAVRSPGSIVSSNTSGVSISAMADGRTEDFRRHFLGTHFFNPPRYMKLLELVPTDNTDPGIVEFLKTFGSRRLGKGVVVARDTPNFIANRIGTFGLLATLEEMARFGLGADDVDALTGPAMGRPKSATFRTLDLVGIDTFAHVAENVRGAARDAEEESVFTLPGFVGEMIRRGWIGEKAGQGFYKREKSGSRREILVLDPATMEYRPRRRLSSAAFSAAKSAPDLSSSLRALTSGEDAASRFSWAVLKRTLLYSASLVGVISDDIVAMDRAMEWGFNWAIGPFAVWDALGVRESVDRMRAEGDRIPDFAVKAADADGFYRKSSGKQLFFTGAGFRESPVDVEKIDLNELKEQGRTVFGNSGASLIDIGDGAACLQFHSPKDAIGSDVVDMIFRAANEVEKNFEALVILGGAANFSVGANLAMILMEAQEENWDEIDFAVRQFQSANMRLKYLSKPVVAAAHGLTLGGGAEISMSASAVQAAAETYIGLVETGAGLIPGGGGCKEMLIRAVGSLPQGAGLPETPTVQRAFETVALAKVSSSAGDAKALGYLRDSDRVTVAEDHLLFESKQSALRLAAEFSPRLPERVPVVGENGAALLKIGVYGMRLSGQISEHDEKIARRLIRVFSGGDAPSGSLVSEQALLDLEREAFLSLCGERKTQDRMRHLLQTGKPFRN